MRPARHQHTGIITETLRGIVDRVTYHNPDNGWSVLRVSPFDQPHEQETVIVHQTRVYAGATMTFHGAWTMHPRHGRQFQAATAIEQKPASAAALEKYLGSGLIKGVGPKTARKIVRHFKEQTLAVFEEDIERLTEVPGIARKKLEMIRAAWLEHRAIREVMMFLQSHGISTLFAVRIYKAYGDQAVAMVSEDPYRLAADFYGIGFFSADKVALSIGLAPDSPQRIMAGIKHVLAAGRQFGHCYLTAAQINEHVDELLGLALAERLPDLLDQMTAEGLVMMRRIATGHGTAEACYYARSLYYDEGYVARRIGAMLGSVPVDADRVAAWIDRYCRTAGMTLSRDQAAAVEGCVRQGFAVLTGGPGVGKTTTTRVLVKLIEAMGRRVLLAAPTGRAAQRMSDVIGREARTIHRLLEWQLDRFKRDEQKPLDTDFLIVDECSMLDISLTASLLKAVPEHGQVLFIGDVDQLPSVGAGNVLRDIIASGRVPCFRLTQVFRQAEQSLIIRYAHQINRGDLPRIDSPFKRPEIWHSGEDCLFFDSDEATREQLSFIAKVKRFFDFKSMAPGTDASPATSPYEFRIDEPIVPYETELTIPEKFRHVDPERLYAAGSRIEELLAVVKKVHPWSSLHYGLSAVDVVQKLYLEWIPKYFGAGREIQILSPMTRGSLGTLSLNALIQAAANPEAPGKRQLKVGERIFREGDRVIHRRNNYDLGVFNGDIGSIARIDNEALTCIVHFAQDDRRVFYQRDDIVELDLAYAITIHKSQGSEFEAVIIPVLTQHFKMLFRNLIYTGLTRARKLAVLVGTRKALAMAVKNEDTSRRQTALRELLEANGRA
ncbi:SF1B family DNA helicase RecD2 [Desulfatitalea tepidiphila]|uniref:SF1B family DNA helicase RecD2 n=1 Tax=Desulfatitalea tepidiphila TaxID=1185843 RepID=UPI0006B5E56E|nr:AAA family ATPase [Desulfatitalea tepidiphila]